MRKSLIVTAAVLLVASVAVAIGWTINSFNRKAKVAEYVTQINAALERNDVEAATAVVDRLATESDGVHPLPISVRRSHGLMNPSERPARLTSGSTQNCRHCPSSMAPANHM